MAKHDPTRQHKEMYHELNTGGTGHTTPHKDLNASAPAELNRYPIGYSKLVDKTNFKSPTQVTQIDGYKAVRGHVSPDNNNEPVSIPLEYKSSDFKESQIPNTRPKFRPEDDLSVTERRMHHQSKSNIFHS